MAIGNATTKKSMTRAIATFEVAGFLALALLVWLDEVLDLPHWLFGAEETPFNWVEGLTESALVLLLGFFVVRSTLRFLRRIRYLEGLLPVCAYCKRIRADGAWVPIEHYVSDHSAASFSHGLCPDCRRERYGETAAEPGGD